MYGSTPLCLLEISINFRQNQIPVLALVVSGSIKWTMRFHIKSCTEFRPFGLVISIKTAIKKMALALSSDATRFLSPRSID